MELIYQIVVVINWIALIYLPLCLVYFAFGIALSEHPERIWRNPLLGIHSFSLKTASLIWMIQLVGAGIIFFEYGKWLRYDICPFLAF
jgi:hypothetical protein